MGKLVVLTLGEGDFQRGFPVTLQIGEDGDPPSTQDTGNLPPNAALPESYKSWQSTYHGYIGVNFRLEKPAAQTTNFSIDEVKEKAEDLSKTLNQWLKSQAFSHIREELLAKLKSDDEVRLIIQTSDIQLRQLPWHLWDLLERYPKAEIALCATKYDRVISHKQSKNHVNILAILGDSAGINVEKDREILCSIPHAKTQFLVKPERREINDQLWDRPCDILFFAGHSRTEGEKGRIYINDTESLTIGELKYGLRKAIAQGLQLAIFNSCDGLGLAQELADLNIPQIIVMREPVPDKVAQEFLKYFLGSFAGGKSFYLSVREARERLQGLESQFTCATWVPIICQIPAQEPLSWHNLHRRNGNLRNIATKSITLGLVTYLGRGLLNRLH